MKKMMKTVWALFGAALCAFGAFAESEVTITSVTAQQRYPWNGKVDIVVTFTCAAEDRPQVDCTFAATNSATKAAIPVAHLTRNGEDTGTGTIWTRKFIWDAAADVGNVKIADVALTADATLGVQLWDKGPYWATCNVGATKPEVYGYYFWWGDTVGYRRNASDNGWVSVATGRSFIFSPSNCPTYMKSDSLLRSAGYIDSVGDIRASHDAATAHLGAPWRMPTDAEWFGHISKCTTTWTTCNGVYGRLVTGKGAFSQKSIFLPAAGEGVDSGRYYAGMIGDYWSSTSYSTPYLDDFYGAWDLHFSSDYFHTDKCAVRYIGKSVRPVRRFANLSTSTYSAMMTHLRLDCTTGMRTMGSAGEQLYYDASWGANGANAQVYDGSTLLASGAKGKVLWQPQTCSSETRILTVKILNSAGSVMATEVASFLTPKLGHSEVVTTAAKAATCTTAGCTKGSYCTRCNATLSTSTIVAALGHSEQVTTAAQAATCTAAGCTSEVYCTRCGATLSTSVTIPAHGSSEGSWPEGAAEIYDRAFEGCELLKRIDLSRNTKLKRIGKRAFADCWDLEEVVLPPNLEVIDEEAFAGCSFVSRIVLPPSVVEIGAGAFEDCSYLQEFVFTGELETLAARTFRGCTQLQKITLPDGMTSVRESAFEDCRRMQSVVLPLSLTWVDSRAFYGCGGLTGVTLPSGVAPMSTWFNSVYTQVRDVQIVPGSTAVVDGFFSGCGSLESVAIPEGVRTIGENAFRNCAALPGVRLPGTLNTIGASAFYSCTRLESVVIPDAVTSIGAYCFYNCLSLHDVTLSQRLTELPDYTFHWCWNLDSFTVPASVTRLGKNLVTGVYHQGVTKGPREIYFLGNAPAYDADTYSGAMSSLTTYIKYNSRGWDGRASSRDIPEAWPTTGSSRAITYWVSRQFDVSYQANGGTFVENGATAYDCLCTTTELYAVPPGNPQREGYRFAGWWTERNGGTQITASTPVVLTKAHTLYAHWEAAVTVTVRFNANGGTVRPGEKICVAGETFGQLPVPTREHFAFAGWYTQARGGYQVNPATEVPQADRELFAHWVEATYVVRFHSNDGRDETYDQYYTYGSSFNLATCRFTNGTRQFNGWARTPVGSVVYAENALFREFGAIEADVVHLYAVWIGDSYVIRFDSNGGDGAMDNQTINVGETKPLDLNVFTRTGWYFIGWSRAYNGSVVYKDGASVKDLTTAKDVVILYAVWQRMPANTYQVIFADGAKRTTEFYAANRVYNLPTSLFTPPTGKRFAGWLGSNGRRYDPGVLVFDLVPAGGTIVLTAIWE